MDLREMIGGRLEPSKLERNAVHVWRLDTAVGANELLELAGLLAPDELARSEKFRFEADMRRFTACRAYLRLLAAAYLGRSPAAVHFCHEPLDKPQLAGDASQHLRFNVSHSGERALLAFALNREVGVDIEFKRRDLDFLDLARTHFSEVEYTAVAASAPQSRTDLFYEYWTCKEACIKADGRGLSVPLGQFSVVPSRDHGWREVVLADASILPAELRVRVLDSDAAYAAAVASLGTDWRVLQMGPI